MKPSRFLRKQSTYEQLAKEQELASLKEENARLIEQIERCNTQIKTANDQLLKIKQRYTSLINDLSVREKAAEQISRLALKEANQIIETARGNADTIVKEAMISAKSVFIEINRLSKQTVNAKEDIQEKLADMNEILDTFKIPEIPNLAILAKKKDDEKE